MGPQCHSKLFAGIVVLIVLIAWLGAAPSFAETGERHPDRSVSTSPTDGVQPGTTDPEPMTVFAADGPPLTRAATQLRIDEMSPIRWLARYGHVSIGHRE